MKKKIIIFSIKSGYGHVATSTALYDYLKNDYEVQIAYIFEDVLAEIDIVSRITRKKFSINEVYNKWFLQGRFLSVIPFSMALVKTFLWLLRNKIARLLIKFLKEQKADYVISVIPLINAGLFQATKNLDIPIFLIPTDLNMNHFLVDLPPYLYKKSYICLMHENKYIKKQLRENKIPPQYVRIIGAVLRPDFFEEKNIIVLKNDLNVESAYVKTSSYDESTADKQKKPIIMVLLGGLGSKKIIDFAKALSMFGVRAHFLFCIGKNEKIGDEIKEIPFEPYLSYSIIGFTDRISDYMKISDVIITKSGTLSVLEGLYMQKPLLLDATTNVLPWEQYNHTFVEESGCGFSLEGYEYLIPRLLLLTSHRQYIKEIKANLQKFERKNGGEEIKKLLENML